MPEKISQLPTGGTLDGTELVPMVQSSTTKRSTLALFGAWIVQTFTGFSQAGAGATARTVQNVLRSAPQFFDSIAALKATSGVDYLHAVTRGYYTAGDGGAGEYFWNASDVTADNGGTVIAPNTGTGRWNLIVGSGVTLKQWGLKTDATDQSAVVQAAFNWAKANQTRIYGQGVSFTISSGLTADYGNMDFDGEGCEITYNGVGGIALTLSATNYTHSTRHSFKGFTLTGSAGSGGTQTAIKFVGDGVTTFGAFSVLDQYVLSGFGTGITWGSNAWADSIGSGFIVACGWAIDYPSGLTNSGERICFGKTTISQCLNGVRANAGALHFLSLSVDYCTNRFLDAEGGGEISATHCHIEGSTDNDYWLVAGAADSSINLHQVQLVLAGAKSSFPIGQCSTNAASQINLGQFSVTPTASSFANYSFSYLIDGWGTVTSYKWRNVSHVDIPVVFSQTNLLEDGGFEKAYIAEPIMVVGTSGGAPTLSAAQHHAGAQSLLLQPNNTGSTWLEIRCNLQPGDQVTLTWWMLTANIVTDVIYMEVDLWDSFNNSVGNTKTVTFSVANGNLPTSWTRGTITASGQALSGAASLRIFIAKGGGSFGLTASEGGTSAAYFDDMYLEIVGKGGVRGVSPLWKWFAKAQTANFSSVTVPAGYEIDSIQVLNSTANAVTGGIDIGTAALGADVVSAFAVGANADVLISGAALLKQYFSSTLAQVLFVSAHTAWNSASVTFVFNFRRAN